MDELPLRRSIALISTFLVFAPIALAASLFTLVHVTRSVESQKAVEIATVNAFIQPQSGARLYASLPVTLPSVSATVVSGDARVEIIRKYLDTYNSPMVAHASEIVEAADRYGIDFRLITAIAQQESNLCKRIPPETFNCWGWGIHSRGTLGFTSFTEGIETVTRGLKQEYIDKGYTDPEVIMSKYTPLSDGSWAHGVQTFLDEME